MGRQWWKNASADIEKYAACSVVGMVETCLEQDLSTFKGSCQDMVDELEELRRRCSQPAHRARITRLLFLIYRWSRVVFTGESMRIRV